MFQLEDLSGNLQSCGVLLSSDNDFDNVLYNYCDTLMLRNPEVYTIVSLLGVVFPVGEFEDKCDSNALFVPFVALTRFKWIMSDVPAARRIPQRMRVWIPLAHILLYRRFSFFFGLNTSSLFLTPLIPLSSLAERAYTKMRSLLARRHTSWLLIHVAADYFPASLWHQIPYSGQNGESASPLPTLRARWSTQASDSHRILRRLFRAVWKYSFLGGEFHDKFEFLRHAFASAKHAREAIPSVDF